MYRTLAIAFAVIACPSTSYAGDPWIEPTSIDASSRRGEPWIDPTDVDTLAGSHAPTSDLAPPRGWPRDDSADEDNGSTMRVLIAMATELRLFIVAW